MVVEVSSFSSELDHTELVDTGESPEFFVTEVVESSPPVLPVPSLAQEAVDILRVGASALWSRLCTQLEAKSPHMVLKEEAKVMSTFEVLAREAVSSSAVTCQNEISEISSTFNKFGMKE
ncbi:hypothetical protein LIER_19565 [Lithospermum erythrorhizon]|uniref:Uncharacterized protein n=1 Tax=Lithospermum erythrorhizon TaxID=34254 RepID=A0AAV3QJ37_LITER